MDDVGLCPMLLSPVYQGYIWGGSYFKKEYERTVPFETTAESWEVSACPDGVSTILNGPCAGMGLDKAAKVLKEELLGSLVEGDSFPLLFKLIDAQDTLSVQVHPDNVYARENENGGSGKTEMWYVLKAENDARLIYGFKQDLTREELEQAIANEELPDHLNEIPTGEGDVVFIDAGMVHAVGRGVVLAEIQQSANITYRLHDWGKVDENGEPRPLHLAKALDVLSLESMVGHEIMPVLAIENEDYTRKMLCCCRYFAAEFVSFDGDVKERTHNRSFHILFFPNDGATIEYPDHEKQPHIIEVAKGGTALIPAGLMKYTVRGKGEYLKYYVPEFDADFLQPLVEHGYTEDQVLDLLR